MPQPRPAWFDREPPGVPARRAALRLLDAVMRQGVPLEAAIDRAAGDLAGPDRALVHAIAAAVLRWSVDLDRLIDGATQRPMPPDAKARMALRIALAQRLVLGTPAHAAIATVLPLVDGGPRKLVQGVFGTLSRGGAALPPRPTLPPCVAERWRAAWGEAAVEAASTVLGTHPPIDLTLADATETGSVAARIDGATSLAPGHLRVPAGAAVTALPGYEAGRWWVQDLAASIPARLAGRGRGRALDLCAAPGGKAMQLAAAGWAVTALDLSERRLARMRDNLARTRLPVELVVGDLMAWRPPAPAELVLLDAPCSATGIFRRHPDVLHRVQPRAIVDLATQQRRMIDRAADWVAPGGLLVYAVCSLEPEEGEAVAGDFLASRPAFAVEPPAADVLPVGIAATADGFVRVTPGLIADPGGADGFFVAAFRRSG